MDRQLGRLLPVIDEVDGILVITADHGNADEMLVKNKQGSWESSTKHSLNPVPFVIYDPKYKQQYQLQAHGPRINLNLSHVAATLFILMGEAPPNDINDSLFRL